MPISLKWCENVQSGRAIVTGSDSNLEWMLPWWHKNVVKYNNYPIYFADFGMSANMRDWCSKYGKVISIVDKFSSLNWFKKPLAILAVPHEYIIWTDVDCEIRGNLDPLFNHATSGIALTLDPHNPWLKKNKNAVASGVVAAKHGNPIIPEWAVACRSTKLRGDQEVLNSIITNKFNQVTIMPPICQWLRVDGDNPKAIIMHWTGNTGKRRIKNMMGVKDQPVRRKIARRTPPPPKSRVVKPVVTKMSARRVVKSLTTLKISRHTRVQPIGIKFARNNYKISRPKQK